MKKLLLLVLSLNLIACANHEENAIDKAAENCDYNNFKTPGDYQSGGVQMIDLKEGYKVWTKRYGNSPMKVLILHGGPAGTHEYLDDLDIDFNAITQQLQDDGVQAFADAFRALLAALEAKQAALQAA